MNFSSSPHAPSERFLRRFRLWKRQYLHVVIYTSLFWIFIDVFVIMFLSDCTKQVIVPCPDDRLLNSRPVGLLKGVGEQPKLPFAEKEGTASHRQNLLNKKKVLQARKNTGFIAKWFGSGSGREKRVAR